MSRHRFSSYDAICLLEVQTNLWCHVRWTVCVSVFEPLIVIVRVVPTFSFFCNVSEKSGDERERER